MPQTFQAEYVLGFMFSADGQDVALIRKDHPEWQAGLYNGIGGKRKKNESYSAAMEREFFEATGINSIKEIIIWRMRLDLNFGTQSKVRIYSHFNDFIYQINSMSSRKVEIFRVNAIYEGLPVISDLFWILPLILDPLFIHGQIELSEDEMQHYG